MSSSHPWPKIDSNHMTEIEYVGELSDRNLYYEDSVIKKV